MPELFRVLLLAMLPGIGNFAGGLVAEWAPASDRWLNRALHAAAGVVIAVIAVEIFPEALRQLSGWTIGTAFVVGGLTYLGFDWLIDRFSGEGRGRMWMIYLAVATDLVGDGLLIGAGASVSASLGVALALGQTLADAPEGFAAIMTFRHNDVPRRRRLLLSASFFLPVLLGALVSFLFLRSRPETWQYTALVVTGGLFTVAALEDMMQEAHEAATDKRVSTLALIGGFALFVFLSTALPG
jgi:ZIP family zinc transporter